MVSLEGMHLIKPVSVRFWPIRFSHCTVANRPIEGLLCGDFFLVVCLIRVSVFVNLQELLPRWNENGDKQFCTVVRQIRFCWRKIRNIVRNRSKLFTKYYWPVLLLGVVLEQQHNEKFVQRRGPTNNGFVTVVLWFGIGNCLYSSDDTKFLISSISIRMFRFLAATRSTVATNKGQDNEEMCLKCLQTSTRAKRVTYSK